MRSHPSGQRRPCSFQCQLGSPAAPLPWPIGVLPLLKGSVIELLPHRLTRDGGRLIISQGFQTSQCIGLAFLLRLCQPLMSVRVPFFRRIHTTTLLATNWWITSLLTVPVASVTKIVLVIAVFRSFRCALKRTPC